MEGSLKWEPVKSARLPREGDLAVHEQTLMASLGPVGNRQPPLAAQVHGPNQYTVHGMEERSYAPTP